MNRFLRIFMWILFLAALFIAIAYFLPKEVNVERTARIEASPKTVYSQVIDLHQWSYWSTWSQIDPEMEVEYLQNGVGVDAGYKWSSDNKNVGSGSLRIASASQLDSIKIIMEFDGQGTANSAYFFTEKEGQTDVTWTFRFDVGNNPLMRWMGIMIKKSVGRAYETGLTNLSARCKVLEQEQEFVVLVDKIEPFYYASIRGEVPFVEISLKMGEMYGQIGTFLAENEMEMAGMPFSFYHLMDDEKIDLECGIPISHIIEGNNLVKTGSFQKTKCATLDFYGDYNNLGEGHSALQQWIEDHDFVLSGAPMEMYLTDPGNEPNPENWLTRICYPIE